MTHSNFYLSPFRGWTLVSTLVPRLTPGARNVTPLRGYPAFTTPAKANVSSDGVQLAQITPLRGYAYLLNLHYTITLLRLSWPVQVAAIAPLRKDAELKWFGIFDRFGASGDCGGRIAGALSNHG